MSKTPEQRANLYDAELKPQDHGERFAFRRASFGKALGLTRVGLSYMVVPPGKAAYPFHRHHVSDEAFVILSGSGEHRWGDERHPVKAGDVLGAPHATEAHQLVNTGAEDLCYLAISDIGSEDILEYPDSGKIAFAAGVKDADMTTASISFMGRLGPPADYYDGEPDGPASAS